MKSKKSNDCISSQYESKLEINEEIYKVKGIPPGAREKILDIIAKSAYNNDRVYEGCTRSVLAALIEHLHLSTTEGAKETIKASTALAGGVCRMGETCGALIGGIMAIGLVTGSEKLEDFSAYKYSMTLSYQLYNKFKSIYNSTRCYEIQQRLFGRSYDFKDKENSAAWYRDGGLYKCPMVCATAARLAAEVILDFKKNNSNKENHE
jgi:C_GCAxxG_C_C family probable redox protein